MAADQLDLALEIAEAQLARLKSGDLDGYLEHEAAYTSACQAVAAAGVRTRAQEVALYRLVGIATELGAELGRLMDETSERLRQLNDRRRVASAYYDAGPVEALNGRQV